MSHPSPFPNLTAEEQEQLNDEEIRTFIFNYINQPEENQQEPEQEQEQTTDSTIIPSQWPTGYQDNNATVPSLMIDLDGNVDLTSIPEFTMNDQALNNLNFESDRFEQLNNNGFGVFDIQGNFHTAETTTMVNNGDDILIDYQNILVPPATDSAAGNFDIGDIGDDTDTVGSLYEGSFTSETRDSSIYAGTAAQGPIPPTPMPMMSLIFNSSTKGVTVNSNKVKFKFRDYQPSGFNTLDHEDLSLMKKDYYEEVVYGRMSNWFNVTRGEEARWIHGHKNRVSLVNNVYFECKKCRKTFNNFQIHGDLFELHNHLSNGGCPAGRISDYAQPLPLYWFPTLDFLDNSYHMVDIVRRENPQEYLFCRNLRILLAFDENRNSTGAVGVEVDDPGVFDLPDVLIPMLIIKKWKIDHQLLQGSNGITFMLNEVRLGFYFKLCDYEKLFDIEIDESVNTDRLTLFQFDINDEFRRRIKLLKRKVLLMLRTYQEMFQLKAYNKTVQILYILFHHHPQEFHDSFQYLNRKGKITSALKTNYMPFVLTECIKHGGDLSILNYHRNYFHNIDDHTMDKCYHPIRRKRDYLDLLEFVYPIDLLP
ncbi:hypothetical protein WICPIJ_007479 [Wickerhamomyces pijperi]|uniref:Uncharacterized protein n=1 Tax=Wickerhamomyces pijperi TaxID=599730 RepID=A0A9P8TK31_WICPI|nr:hypothetical protein WICPIJ_007479 [Wickerhamomyces pijperi]